MDCKIKVAEKASSPFLARARAFERWKVGPHIDMRANIQRARDAILDCHVRLTSADVRCSEGDDDG